MQAAIILILKVTPRSRSNEHSVIWLTLQCKTASESDW